MATQLGTNDANQKKMMSFAQARPAISIDINHDAS
jgi:hypothetical protein